MELRVLVFFFPNFSVNSYIYLCGATLNLHEVVPWKLLMVVKVALWYELWTTWWSFVRLFSSSVISLLRKLSSYCTLTKWRRPPTRGTHWLASQMMPLLRSSTTYPPAPCSPTNVSIAPRNASSRTTISWCPILWPTSSMMESTAKETSPASPVFIPPCPSCPSPWIM